MVARLAGQVRSLTVRWQLSDGEYVVTICDLDLGTGPTPTAEWVRVDSGELPELELICDSATHAAA